MNYDPTSINILASIIQLMIMLLGAGIFGYLIGRTCGCVDVIEHDHDDHRHHLHNHDATHASYASPMPVAQTVSHVATPMVAHAPRSTKDDLKIIEGIGPAIEKLLNAEGIHTFDDVARISSSRIVGILEKAGPIFASHNPASWGEQAMLARDGRWTELENLKRELVGGLRV